jgi:uncharacterized membrane protein
VRLNSGSNVKLGAAPGSPVAQWRLPDQPLLNDTSADGVGWMRAMAWSFLALGLAFYLFVVRFTQNPADHLSGHVKVLIVVAACEVVLMAVLRRAAEDVRIGKGLRLLQDAAKAEDALPVRIEIRQKGALTGADEGFVWLKDGTLFFRGIASVWRLNAQDTAPPQEWSRRVNRAQSPTRRVIPLQAAGRPIELTINFIDPYEDYAARRRAEAFSRSLRAWAVNRPEGFVETVLPPLDVHPALRLHSSRRWEGVTTGAALTVINLGLALSAMTGLSPATLSGAVEWLKLLVGLGLAAFTLRFALRQRADQETRRAVFLENQLNPPLGEA